MKDLVKIIISIIVVLGVLLLAACSNSAQPPKPQPNEEEKIVEVDASFPVSASLRIIPITISNLFYFKQEATNEIVSPC